MILLVHHCVTVDRIGIDTRAPEQQKPHTECTITDRVAVHSVRYQSRCVRISRGSPFTIQAGPGKTLGFGVNSNLLPVHNRQNRVKRKRGIFSYYRNHINLKVVWWNMVNLNAFMFTNFKFNWYISRPWTRKGKNIGKWVLRHSSFSFGKRILLQAYNIDPLN